MRSKALIHLPAIFSVFLISVPPAFSMTPEQCNAATEACLSKCNPTDMNKFLDCQANCSSKVDGPCKENIRGPAANKGPNEPGTSGKAPNPAGKPPASAGTDKGSSKGAIHPVMGSPTNAGNNKESTGGGSNKSSGGRH